MTRGIIKVMTTLTITAVWGCHGEVNPKVWTVKQ
jgi:hypothetical protein